LQPDRVRSGAAGCAAPAPAAGRVSGSVEVRLGGLELCANCLRPDPARIVFQLSANGRQLLLIQTGPSGRFHATLPPWLYIARAFTDQADEGLCRRPD